MQRASEWVSDVSRRGWETGLARLRSFREESRASALTQASRCRVLSPVIALMSAEDMEEAQFTWMEFAQGLGSWVSAECEERVAR